jgi:hypothetical protein
MIPKKKYLACSEVPVFNLTCLMLDQVGCSIHYTVTSQEHSLEYVESKLCSHIHSKCVYGWDVLLQEANNWEGWKRRIILVADGQISCPMVTKITLLRHS